MEGRHEGRDFLISLEMYIAFQPVFIQQLRWLQIKSFSSPYVSSGGKQLYSQCLVPCADWVTEAIFLSLEDFLALKSAVSGETWGEGSHLGASELLPCLE